MSGRSVMRVAVALLAIGLIVTGARAGERTMVVLGTATPGGGFPVYGDALAAAINAADATLDVQTRNTKGSGENIPLLEAGQLDIALVQGESAYEALNGIGRAPANLKILTAMYSSPGLFVVRADSPHRSIADLKGKRIAFGAAGSGLVILARYVLDGLGLDQNKDFQAIYLERAGDGPKMIEDGTADALWGGGLGWPGFAAVARQPKGARFIAPTSAEIQRIQAKHSFLKTMTVPAGTYPGLNKDLPSVGSWSYVLMRPDLDEAVAFRVAKALHAAEGDLGRRLPVAAETTARNTVAVVDRSRLHPGVANYLREAGLLP